MCKTCHFWSFLYETIRQTGIKANSVRGHLQHHSPPCCRKHCTLDPQTNDLPLPPQTGSLSKKRGDWGDKRLNLTSFFFSLRGHGPPVILLGGLLSFAAGVDGGDGWGSCPPGLGCGWGAGRLDAADCWSRRRFVVDHWCAVHRLALGRHGGLALEPVCCGVHAAV